MKRHILVASVLLGTACVASGQYEIPDNPPANRNAAAQFSASSSEPLTLVQPLSSSLLAAPANLTFPPAAAPSAASASSDASPTPAPTPKFLYGGRDDFRWQLAIGVDWIRFRSNIFNASGVGIKASGTYFT